MTTEPLPETPDQERRKSRAWIFALAGFGAALLIAVVVLLVVLLSGDDSTSDPTPTPSITQSATPSATPSPSVTASSTPTSAAPPTPTAAPPAPPSNDTRINTFSVSDTTVFCNESSPVDSHQFIAFSWNTSNVNRVYFGVNTNDASAGPFFDNLPPSGNSQNDFPAGYTDFEYPCPTDSVKYTLTVVGPTGKVSKSVTVTNTGD